VPKVWVSCWLLGGWVEQSNLEWNSIMSVFFGCCRDIFLAKDASAALKMAGTSMRVGWINIVIDEMCPFLADRTVHPIRLAVVIILSVCLSVTKCLWLIHPAAIVSDQVNRKCFLRTRYYNFQPPTPILSPQTPHLFNHRRSLLSGEWITIILWSLNNRKPSRFAHK